MKKPVFLVGLILAGCMSPGRFEAKFESKFCEEWDACNPDLECELPPSGFGSCDFDAKAAKECLNDAGGGVGVEFDSSGPYNTGWHCDYSNGAMPSLTLPEACWRVYPHCSDDVSDTGDPRPGAIISYPDWAREQGCKVGSRHELRGWSSYVGTRYEAPTTYDYGVGGLTYAWRVVSGDGTVDPADEETTIFVASAPGTMVVGLVVNDGYLDSSESQFSFDCE